MSNDHLYNASLSPDSLLLRPFTPPSEFLAESSPERALTPYSTYIPYDDAERTPSPVHSDQACRTPAVYSSHTPPYNNAEWTGTPRQATTPQSFYSTPRATHSHHLAITTPQNFYSAPPATYPNYSVAQDETPCPVRTYTGSPPDLLKMLDLSRKKRWAWPQSTAERMSASDSRNAAVQQSVPQSPMVAGLATSIKLGAVGIPLDSREWGTCADLALDLKPFENLRIVIRWPGYSEQVGSVSEALPSGDGVITELMVVREICAMLEVLIERAKASQEKIEDRYSMWSLSEHEAKDFRVTYLDLYYGMQHLFIQPWLVKR